MRRRLTYRQHGRTWLLLLSHFLLCSFAQSLSAQSPAPESVTKKVKPWRLGIEGGLDISRFSASRELFSPDSHTGWFLGAKVSVNIPMPNLSIDGAILYNQSRLEYQEQDVYRHKNLHMFVVPVNLRYTWTIVPAFGLMIFTGPQWNWLLDKKSIGTVGELQHSFFDWNVGMGFEVVKHVQLAFNYNIPLGKMGEVNSVNLEGHTWNIRFAYLF